MSDKKKFFELLNPRWALTVGAVGGLMAIGTIGFIVLGVVKLQSWKTGGASIANNSGVVLPTTDGGGTAAAGNKPTAAQPAGSAVPKAVRPKVELFVMSYCPYGLQMEKAFLPAMTLLQKKADLSVKFVYYAMHGKKEVDENTRQYCIQQEQPAKYASYLQCFFAAGQNDGNEAHYADCLGKVNIDQKALVGCVNKTDQQFAITAKFNDQTSWLSGQFPLYPIHNDLNQSYGVQGSPTLIVNGVQAQSARTPEAVKQTICAAFQNPPAECGQTLATTAYVPGFGLNAAASGGSTQPGCGT